MWMDVVKVFVWWYVVEGGVVLVLMGGSSVWWREKKRWLRSDDEGDGDVRCSS